MLPTYHAFILLLYPRDTPYKVLLFGPWSLLGVPLSPRLTSVNNCCWLRSYSFLNAGVRGIPHAFVVDGEGKIRYSGHPAQPEFAATVDKWLGVLKPVMVRRWLRDLRERSGRNISLDLSPVYVLELRKVSGELMISPPLCRATNAFAAISCRTSHIALNPKH